MRPYRPTAVLLALALALGSLIGVASPAQAAPSGTYTFDQLVNLAPPVRPLYVGYPGQQAFIPPAVAAKKDARGCNLRQRILIASATVAPKVGAKCKIVGGVWVSSVSGRQIKSAKGVVMDLTMPMKAAWAQGAYAWTPAQRLAWATQVRSGKSLRAKGVTQLPGTNVILAANEVSGVTSAQMWRGMSSSTQSLVPTSLVEFCLTNGAKSGLGCIFAALSMSQLLGFLQEDNRQAAYASGTEALRIQCTGFASYLGNIVQWGLSISPEVKSQLTDVSQLCAEFQFAISPAAQVQGIKTITNPSEVPTLDKVQGSNALAIVPPYSNYAAPVTDRVPASLFGMHAPVDWGNPNIPIGSMRLWDAGVSWREIEISQGTYEWGTFDRALDQAQALTGQGALYVLGNTPKWANGGQGGAALPASSFGAAANFAKKVCERSAGRIAMFEVWNEGNLSTYWAGTQQELAQLTAAVRDAVHSCNPNIKVLASSTGVRAQQAFGTNYDAYLAHLSTMGWPVDGYAVHSYPSATGGPQDRVANLGQFKSMLVSRGAPVKPIYDTELNYGLAGMGQGKVDVPQAKGAAWLSTSYIQSVQYGIDGVYWYVWSPSGDPTVGIQFTPGTPEMKKAWENTRNWLVGARMQRCGEAGPLQMCQLTDSAGRNFSLLWLDSQPADPSAGLTKIPAGLGTSICPLLGECSSLGSGEVSVQIGIEPVRIG